MTILEGVFLTNFLKSIKLTIQKFIWQPAGSQLFCCKQKSRKEALMDTSMPNANLKPNSVWNKSGFLRRYSMFNPVYYSFSSDSNEINKIKREFCLNASLVRFFRSTIANCLRHFLLIFDKVFGKIENIQTTEVQQMKSCKCVWIK